MLRQHEFIEIDQCGELVSVPVNCCKPEWRFLEIVQAAQQYLDLNELDIQLVFRTDPDDPQPSCDPILEIRGAGRSKIRLYLPLTVSEFWTGLSWPLPERTQLLKKLSIDVYKIFDSPEALAIQAAWAIKELVLSEPPWDDDNEPTVLGPEVSKIIDFLAALDPLSQSLDADSESVLLRIQALAYERVEEDLDDYRNRWLGTDQ
jgi:hypothetical protein